MRMWMVDPKLLCKKHLQGEPFEIHLHLHNFQKHHSVTGRISPVVLIEPASMKFRHDLLAQEMLTRGGKHNSPYEQPDISYLPDWQQEVKADLNYNLKDLTTRCEECAKRINTSERSQSSG